MVDRLLAQAFAPASGRLAEIARRVQTRTVMELAFAVYRPEVGPAAKAEMLVLTTELTLARPPP